MANIDQKTDRNKIIKIDSEIVFNVDVKLMKRIYFALEVARDNAIELYNDHMNKVGEKPTTKKDEYLAKLLKDDADEANDLVKGLAEKWDFGV